MFYKVVLNGIANAQDVKNVLYYRTGVGVDVSGFTMGGAEALAGNIKQEIWPKWKHVVNGYYMLETIDVYPISETFQLVYQNPFSLAVAENGDGGSASIGPAPCLNFKFNLEATAILANGIKPPKRGYVSVGPIASSMMDSEGYLQGTIFNDATGDVRALAIALGSNIEQLLPVPFVWYPIRMKSKRGLLEELTMFESFADVRSATVDRRISWRRSRMAGN